MKFTRRAMIAAMAAAVPTLSKASERRRAHKEFFETVELDLWLAGLSAAHDGLVIAQLSDLHIGSGVPDGRIIAAVNAVNEAKPDLIMLTGDFVTSRWDPYERVPQLLGNLRAPSFAVLGNHDHWSNPVEVRRGLEGIGVTVLQNANTVVRRGGVDFTIIGIDDSTTRNDDLEAAFRGASAGSRLVLTHTPAAARKLPAWDGLLQLSGHTHGGQWDVPRLTEGIFKRAGQPWYRGWYQTRGNQLYVNRGLGFGKGTRMPRLNSDPEVSLLTLRTLDEGSPRPPSEPEPQDVGDGETDG